MCCGFPSRVAGAEVTLICKLGLEPAIKDPILIYPSKTASHTVKIMSA